MEIEGFGERVRDLTGLEVDIVSSRTIENPDLAEAIEREGVVVYER
jgi:predicted nucleotidyltransferase